MAHSKNNSYTMLDILFFPADAAVFAESVFIGTEEKLTVVLSKTGGLESLEVQGTMSLVISNEADAFVSIAVSGKFCCCILWAEEHGSSCNKLW